MPLFNQLEIWPLLRRLDSPSDQASFPLANIVLPTVNVGDASSLLLPPTSLYSGRVAAVAGQFAAWEIHCLSARGSRVEIFVGDQMVDVALSTDRLAALCAAGDQLTNERAGREPSACTIFTDTIADQRVMATGPWGLEITTAQQKLPSVFLNPDRYLLIQANNANVTASMGFLISDLL